MRYYVILAAVIGCVSVPALSFGNNGGPRKDTDIVCRQEQGMETGSHLRRAPRVCRTRAEWRENDEHTERDIRIVRDQNVTPDKDALGSPTAPR